MTLTELKEKYNSFSNNIKALIILTSFIFIFVITSVITSISMAGAMLAIAIMLGGVWFIIKAILDVWS